ncbi:AMP-binding protein, partial [Pseudomonadales bacterium]|nr:AMP-binding protein [Pseudomonadales bacterium]
DIPWLLNQWAERTPDKVFLHWSPFDLEDASWTYAEFQQQVILVANNLAKSGVFAGDRVLIHMDNCPEFLLCWFACAHLGAIAVSTNTRSVARDLTYFAEFAEVSCAITQPTFARLLRSSAPKIKSLFVTDGDVPDSEKNEFRPFSELLERSTAVATTARAADPWADLGIQFTSGTTSRPKAVLWTHANAVWGAQVNATQMRLRHEDCTLIVLPLFHTNAQSYSMLSTLWAGGTMVLQPRFSASRFWLVSARYGCSWASLIPFCVKALASQPVPEENHYRFWGLGAHLPEVQSRYNIQTIGWWGMTETITQGIIGDIDHPGPRLSMGRSSFAYDVRVTNEANELCGVGEKGFLTIRGVRGVSLFKEYYKNPEANRESFDQHGWFVTGDVVRFDENGNLFFCDREKDMLKVGAENVAASEIETIIMSSGLVSECAVVAQKHDMLDEVPVAFVILSEKIPRLLNEVEQEKIKRRIIDHCVSNLADFKVVRAVHIVDSLPRSTLEKIAKNELRDRLPLIVSASS